MITYADVEKLLATRSEDPPVLSLYMEMPLDLPALRGLPARAPCTCCSPAPPRAPGAAPEPVPTSGAP